MRWRNHKVIRRSIYAGIATTILVGFSATTAFAQVAELRGHVLIELSNKQRVPLVGAQVDIFRTDLKGTYNATTDAKGEFVVAGLPYIGTYVVAASHSGVKPNWMSGVKVGRGVPVEITVTRGSGKRLTYEEIKAAEISAPASAPSANGGGGESGADARAKADEIARKNAEIEANNRRIDEANATVARTFTAGNQALTAASVASKAHNPDDAIQKYTAAIAQYDEGLAADAEQPAILTNKAVALKGRGAERFNATISSKTLDDVSRAANLDAAKKDFRAAAEASSKAVTLLKSQSTPTDPAELQRYNGNMYAAMLTRAESLRLVVSKVDPNQSAAATTAFKEYIAVEPDPAKKDKAQFDLAQTLLDAGEGEKALEEFKAILMSHPDSPEANFGAGFAAYSLDKPRHQEAANYMQRFVDLAPDSNPKKGDARMVLDDLKATENITPRATRPGGRRP